MDDEVFLRQFEDAAFPCDEWHHREHIKVAYLYLLRFPVDAAIERMRAGIQRLNAVHKVPDAPTRGYHETITQAWMRLVHFTMSEYGPAESADQFFDQHPQLWQMKVLRLFYSKDRLMSAEAKVGFIQPDISNFPIAKSR